MKMLSSASERGVSIAVTHGVPTGMQAAIKFYMDKSAFQRERDLYQDTALKTMMPATLAIEDNYSAHCRTPYGYIFPSFVIIECGQSLDEWARDNKNKDFITIFQVCRCRPCLHALPCSPALRAPTVCMRLCWNRGGKCKHRRAATCFGVCAARVNESCRPARPLSACLPLAVCRCACRSLRRAVLQPRTMNVQPWALLLRRYGHSAALASRHSYADSCQLRRPAFACFKDVFNLAVTRLDQARGPVCGRARCAVAVARVGHC